MQALLSPYPDAPATLRVLVVAGDGDAARRIDALLTEGFSLVHEQGLESALDRLADERVDCVLLDLGLPDGGIAALELAQGAALDAPVIALDSVGDAALALRAVQAGAQDVLDAATADAAGLARSISYAVERQRRAAELAHRALHDPLTGLPNRTLFLDRLAQAISKSRRHGSALAVMFLDVDRFKAINDALGHDAGDRVLVAVARRLSRVLRAGDTAARFGGDEFALLCEDVVDADHAILIAERLLAEVQEPLVNGTDELPLRVSLGVAVRGPGESRADSLVRDADAAMYRAKQRGGATWELCDDEVRDRVERRRDVESALRDALTRGELRVHYQPQVRLSTGEIAGVEALVRWEHPEHGIVTPREFLDAAEESGLIVPLGAWVLGEACRQAARWNAARPAESPLLVSVNLSARQCAHPELIAAVRRALDEAQVDPAHVCLEVSETAVGDVHANVAVLEALKGLGLTLALDDFGTGAGSLRAIQRWPVDLVKVDRSLVDDIERDAEAASLVGAVVGLAHGRGLVAVAEGVEVVGQLDRLRALGCDVAQGYYFARPDRAETLEARLGLLH